MRIPHACGDEPESVAWKFKQFTVFPTHVGMNRGQEIHKPKIGSIPHACGDEPERGVTVNAYVEYSPRMWG